MRRHLSGPARDLSFIFRIVLIRRVVLVVCFCLTGHLAKVICRWCRDLSNSMARLSIHRCRPYIPL